MANEVINKVHDEVPNSIIEVDSAYVSETEPLAIVNLGVNNYKVDEVRKSFTHWWKIIGKKYKVLPRETGDKPKNVGNFGNSEYIIYFIAA